MKKNNIEYSHWLLILSAIFIFIFVVKSPVSHTGSDPMGSLLLSQSLIQDKTLKLDKYNTENYTYKIHRKNDHYYYYFPIGTSLSSIPFVWFSTNFLGMDMENPRDESITQKQIAGFLSVIIFLILYLIAKLYFPTGISIFIALTFWMGTSLSSTLGQALWSQVFATFYALLSIFLMLKITKNNEKSYLYIVLLGVVLFMAYLTRPTMSLMTLFVVAYIFFNNKKLIAIKIASLVGFLLSIFVTVSLIEFKQVLPDYYLPKRLESETFWIALYGNLFSPARGIFIFSPFLIFLLFHIKGWISVVNRDKTLLILVAWVIIHLITISKFPHWWAGHSYGPRFMTDVLPVIYLLFLIILSNTFKYGGLIEKRMVLLFLIITLAFSIFFNSIQGLYNRYAGLIWNGVPNIDFHPELLFDWEYPQFLHNEERHIKRLRDSYLRNLPIISSGTVINHNDDRVYFEGWSGVEARHRWSSDEKSVIYFKLSDVNNFIGVLSLELGTLGIQNIKIKINDYYIIEKDFNGFEIKESIFFDKNILIDGQNKLEFYFSNPHAPSAKDKRLLAMLIRSFSVY